jgi:hypothetical protein
VSARLSDRTAVAIAAILFLAFLLAGPPKIAAQTGSAIPSGASVVKPHSYVSLDEVPAGHSFEVAIVMDILNGYHVNSHMPSEQYLIPTGVTLTPTAGFRELGTTYPDGQMLQFDFSKEKLSVYSGTVTIRAKLAADSSVALGGATLPFTLRFQACNMTACLPPVKVPVPVKVKVEAADAKPHPAHPEIFKSQSNSAN